MSKQIKMFKGGDTKKIVAEANEFMKDIPENEVYQVIGLQSGFNMRIETVVLVVYHQSP